jgi:hypothetical protein
MGAGIAADGARSDDRDLPVLATSRIFLRRTTQSRPLIRCGQSSGSKAAPPTVRFSPEAEADEFRVLRNKKPALLRAFCVLPAAATEAEGTAEHIRLDGRVFVPAHLTAIRI